MIPYACLLYASLFGKDLTVKDLKKDSFLDLASYARNLFWGLMPANNVPMNQEKIYIYLTSH